MQPPRTTGPGEPARALPIAKVSTGMTVVAADGEEVGTVTAVEMPGTDVRPEVPDEQAASLISEGYLRAGGTGPLTSAWYADGSQVADVTTTDDEGVVTLSVDKQRLRRAG
jgi:hypothetical protein